MKYVLTASSKRAVLVLQEKKTSKLLTALKKAFYKAKDNVDFYSEGIRSIDEFVKVLKKMHNRVDLIIFNFKADKGEINLGKDGWVTFEELFDAAGEQLLRGKHIHFAGNEILRERKDAKFFKDFVKAKAVSGYVNKKSAAKLLALNVSFIGLYFSRIFSLKYLFDLTVRNLGITLV